MSLTDRLNNFNKYKNNTSTIKYIQFLLGPGGRVVEDRIGQIEYNFKKIIEL